MPEMTKKQSAAMRVLKAIGKQGASAVCVADETKIRLSDVLVMFDLLAKHNFVLTENNTAKLAPKFLKDVPQWKDMKNAVMCVYELEK